MRWLPYNLLFAIGYTGMLPFFLWRMWRRGGYRNRMGDRFGVYPPEIVIKLRGIAAQRPFWIHAVSVGEVYVAGQMMRALRAENPQLRFVFSTTSSTGWREAQKQIAPVDTLIYNPLDFPLFVKRALKLISPGALILTESEVWPNLIRACHKRKIPLFLINARVSDRSAPGYRRLRFWFGAVLRMFTAIQAQSENDRQRLIAAGAAADTIEVTGSFKFDVAVRDPQKEGELAHFLATCDCGTARTILLGGSTWPGEDAALLRIYQHLLPQFPDLRLVIVPRHFEKADAVQQTIEKAGFVCIRKSKVMATECHLLTTDGKSVVLADTTGELMGFYGNAQIVFVGKSLCEHGSQNMIEPCLCGAATIVGPHTENFRPVMSDLLASDAIIQIANEEELSKAVERLLRNPNVRNELGVRATAAVMLRKGVVGRCAAKIVRLT